MHDGIVAAFGRLASERPLIVSSGRSATVGVIDGLSRRIAATLAEAGIRPGHLVGLASPNGPAFLSAFLGLRRAGAAVLLLDPQGPPTDRRRTAEGLGASALLECPMAWPETSRAWSLTTLSPEAPAHLPGVAVVKLTSGSTGRPRGVVTPEEALLADDAALARTMDLRTEERILCSIPMSHSYGLSSVVLPALVRGSLVVVPEEGNPLSPLLVAAEAGATFFPTAPAYLQVLLKMSQAPPWPPTIRLVIAASAVLPAETAARFRQVYGRPVHVFYGATECGGICYDRDGGAAERGTVGAPVEGVRVTLGPDGLVAVESPSVAAGYFPDPDPRLGGGRFETSDVAEWQGAEVALRGRRDNVINVKGKKVDPSEVEAVLSGLAGVDEVVALGVPGREPGSEMVRAVIACAPGRLTCEDVLAWCRSRLPDHKIPRSIVLVPEIPRTARGKVSRSALVSLEAHEA